MESAPKAKLATRKGFFWLWWSYLRLAMDTEKPSNALKVALERSKGFYREWEMDSPKYQRHRDFGRWWKDKSHLFEEKNFVRELEKGEFPNDPNALVLEVPLTFSKTELAKQVRKIIEEAARKRRDIKSKSHRFPTASFSLSRDSEPKYLALRDMMVVYRDIHLPNKQLKLSGGSSGRRTKPLRGIDLLIYTNDHFMKRREPHKKVPHPLIQKNQIRSSIIDKNASAAALRSLNRYMHRAEAIILNVARGEFPGDYGQRA